MGNTLNFVCALFLLSLVGKGYCYGFENVTISQSRTGQLVENKPEWKVTLKNDCPCTQLNLKLACDGFNTVENVDSSILSKSGGACLVNNGEPVYAFSTVNFTYAWDTSFPFKPISSEIACS